MQAWFLLTDSLLAIAGSKFSENVTEEGWGITKYINLKVLR